MDARLEVEIGANIKDLQSKVNSATKDLQDFGNDSKKNLGNFSKSANTANKSISNFSKGAISGTSAMTAFSRTIQDAPFGIMGVSNNITNLTEQFGYLKNKTGSAGGALKAMLRDLKGFGGISLLISVATSAMLLFGDKIFATKDKVKDLKKEQEELSKSLENYALQLETVARASLKGEQSAQKEIVAFRVLASQVNNTTLSLNKRKGAIEDLRKKYPEYLQNMSDEKLLNGGLATVYDTLTTSIIKRAKATASMNAIIKNSEQLLNIESQLASKQNEIKTKQIQLENATRIAQARAGKERGAVNFSIARQNELQKELNALKKEENKLEGQRQGIELANIDLEQNVNNLGGIAKIVRKKVKKELNKEKIIYVPEIQVSEPKIEILETIDEGSEWVGDSPFNWDEYFKLKEFDKNKTLLQEKMLAVNKQMTNLIQGNLASTFSEIGRVIGNGLAQGTDVLAAVGGALISGIGNLISAMGNKLIELGTAAILAGTVTKLFGSIAGIGAGFAAIAGGIALNAVGASISNFGGAGAGGSNAQAGSGSRGGSSSGGFTGGFSGGGNGTVVFEIAGTKLIGVLSNTLQRNKNLGGSLQITT